MKPRRGRLAQQGLDFCDHRSTERAQFRPGVVVELVGMKCDPLCGGGIGNVWKGTGQRGRLSPANCIVSFSVVKDLDPKLHSHCTKKGVHVT